MQTSNTPLSSAAGVYAQEAAAPSSTRSSKQPALSGASTSSASDRDSIELSAGSRTLIQVGRIALNEKAGNLTSAQASQLYAQVAATQNLIKTDQAANGGSLNAADLESIRKAQDATGQQIYSAAHNGAAAPAPGTVEVSSGELRNLAQIARVGLDQKAGDLTGTQASGLYAQIQATHEQIAADRQANGGPLTAAQAEVINQIQNQTSLQIQNGAHPVSG